MIGTLCQFCDACERNDHFNPSGNNCSDCPDTKECRQYDDDLEEERIERELTEGRADEC